MTKKAILITIAIVLAFSVAGYIYYTGEDYKLYNKALELKAKGDIYEAHEVVSEAMRINPKNRKAISLKAELYMAVKNDTFLKVALKARSDALRAIDRGDYSYASNRLQVALENIDNISTMSKEYKPAKELESLVIADAEKVLREAPESYYKRALDFSSKGEFERAYDVLDYLNKPSQKVIKLKDELAFKIGDEKYLSVVSGRESNPIIIKEAIMWFSKVSNTSPEAINVKVKINELKGKLK